MLCVPGSTVDDCLPKARRHPCATRASWCVFVRLIVVCMDTWMWPCCCKSHALEQNRVQKRAKTRVQKRAKTRVQKRPPSPVRPGPPPKVPGTRPGGSAQSLPGAALPLAPPASLPVRTQGGWTTAGQPQTNKQRKHANRQENNAREMRGNIQKKHFLFVRGQSRAGNGLSKSSFALGRITQGEGSNQLETLAWQVERISSSISPLVLFGFKQAFLRQAMARFASTSPLVAQGGTSRRGFNFNPFRRFRTSSCISTKHTFCSSRLRLSASLRRVRKLCKLCLRSSSSSFCSLGLSISLAAQNFCSWHALQP